MKRLTILKIILCLANRHWPSAYLSQIIFLFSINQKHKPCRELNLTLASNPYWEPNLTVTGIKHNSSWMLSLTKAVLVKDKTKTTRYKNVGVNTQ